MRLTSYTDYSLRVLMYLGLKDGSLTTIQEIADSYQISKNHLMKIVHELNLKGYIDSMRGKRGGIRLGRPAAEIRLGRLIRDTEQDFALAECFSSCNECVITPACRINRVLADGLNAFLQVLDSYSLADMLSPDLQPQLIRLLQIDEAPTPLARLSRKSRSGSGSGPRPAPAAGPGAGE